MRDDTKDASGEKANQRNNVGKILALDTVQ